MAKQGSQCEEVGQKREMGEKNVQLSSEETEQNELCEKKREKEFFKCPQMTAMLMTPAELVSSAGLVCWRLFN